VSRYDVRDKTVAITGAGRGLGAALARVLHARGANLALLGRAPEPPAAVADMIGSRAAWWEADVTDSGSVASSVAAAAEHFGGIDVVVANAGINNFTAVAGRDADAFERVIDVNLLGSWRTVHAAVPYVAERRGYVLLISSLAACIHAPLQGHYAASKAAIAALADSLRIEMKPAGARVGVAYLTFVRTDMMTRDTLGDPAGRLVWAGNKGPFGMVTPEETVAALVRGIERRSRKIVVPRRMLPVVLASGAFQPVIEPFFRPRRIAEAIRASDSRR